MRLSAIIRGNRSVESGSFPLYRLCVLFGAVASTIQIVYGAPESVLRTTAPWFGWMFIGLQLIGSTCILFALYFPRLDVDDGLRVEQIGALFLAGAGTTYVLAVSMNNGGPPATYATWLVIALTTYLLYRIVEIQRLIRTLMQEVRDEHKRR